MAAFAKYKQTDGVESSTGELGQAVASSVGMAIAQTIFAERFNSVGFPIINNYTYCLVSDGSIMEGVTLEACSLAGSLNLSKLILLYDCNDVTSDGNISLCNNENVVKKFKAMGWNVVKCKNGNSFQACSRAIGRAKKADKPTIVIFKTTIGLGTEKEGTSSIEGIALSKEEIKNLNKKLGVYENFYVPNDVRDWCMASSRRGKLNHEKWNQELAIYANSNPELYKQFTNFFDRNKVNIEKLSHLSYKWSEMTGTDMNRAILNEIADKLPQMVGGTSDESHYTEAVLSNSGNYSQAKRRGKNIHFGTRQHAMAGIINGISLYEDFIPFGACSLEFAHYMLPSIKYAAKMGLKDIFYFVYDEYNCDFSSKNENIALLRKIENLSVFKPADSNELLACYQYVFTNSSPVAIILSKQKMAVIEGKFKESLQGGYLLKPAKKDPEITVISNGSEMGLALKVADELSKKYEVSLVSMPCLEIFERQSAYHKNKVLPASSFKIVIENSNDDTLHKYINGNGMFINPLESIIELQWKDNLEKNLEKEILKKISKELNKENKQ